MVSAYYRKHQSIAGIRKIAATDRQGTNLAGLVQAAERIGFRSRGVRATIGNLDEIQLPAIAHWREDGRNHFVVIYSRSRRGVRIGDPALGRRRVSLTKFAACWTGVLLLLEPTDHLRSLATPSLRMFRSLLGRHRKLFANAVLAAVLMTILGLSSSFFIQALVDFVFVFERESTLNWLSLGMLLVLLARVAFLGLRAYLLAHLSRRIDTDIVLGYHDHLLGLPLEFFSARRTGEVLSRLGDAARIRAAAGSAGVGIVVDTLTLSLVSAVMLWMNWRLALLALSLTPVLLITIWLLTGPMKRAQRLAMEKAAEFESHTVEVIGAIEAVKSFGAEDRMRLRGETRFAGMIAAGFRSQLFAIHAGTAAALLTGLASLGLLWFGGHEVLAGRLTIRQLMALYTMLGMIAAPAERLAAANQTIQDALIAGERLGEIFQLETERAGEPSLPVERRIDGGIQFEKVRFRYGNRTPVLDNVSFRIDPGDCVRIAGPSGSGKSTLVRLLVRFFAPESGRILIDGIDVRDYSLTNLRRQVGLVSQHAELLSASITDNIRLGQPGASAADIRAAAAVAGVDRIVRHLPLGYDTVIGERGLTLSGGERQRLALARAILSDPPILILDEPTNHLDHTSEAAVRALIEQRQGRRTTIVISHSDLPVDRTVHIDAHAYAIAT